MKRPAWFVPLLISTLLAALVWALSPAIAGAREPLDARNHYYPVALAIAGVLAGIVSPRIRWAFFLGAVAGQLLFALLFLKTGTPAMNEVALLGLYSMVFLASAIIATYLREGIAALRRRS
jgi:hypothetical protein